MTRIAYKQVHRALRLFWRGEGAAGQWQQFVTSTDPRLLAAALYAVQS